MSNHPYRSIDCLHPNAVVYQDIPHCTLCGRVLNSIKEQVKLFRELTNRINNNITSHFDGIVPSFLSFKKEADLYLQIEFITSNY